MQNKLTITVNKMTSGKSVWSYPSCRPPWPKWAITRFGWSWTTVTVPISLTVVWTFETRAEAIGGEAKAIKGHKDCPLGQGWDEHRTVLVTVVVVLVVSAGGEEMEVWDWMLVERQTAVCGAGRRGGFAKCSAAHASSWRSGRRQFYTDHIHDNVKYLIGKKEIRFCRATIY